MEQSDTEANNEGYGAEHFIEIRLLQEHIVSIPCSLAIELAYGVCTEYAAVRSDLETEDIDISQPSDNRHETDGFHMFLALMRDLSVDSEEVGASFGQNRLEPQTLELHTSIALERINSDQTNTGLSNGYDIISGRFRRAIRKYEHDHIVKADAALISAAKNGDETAFTHIFERNGDDIINDIIRHGHEAPTEIIDLAELAVRELVEASEPNELAEAGLDKKVQARVRELVLDMIPGYRAELEREKQEKLISQAVARLNVATYFGQLIKFEEAEAYRELNKNSISQVVNAGIDHLRARADHETNPGIEILDRLSNADKRMKRYRDLRDEFGRVFRQHIIHSYYMKQEGIEEIDLVDIYNYTDQGHSRRWSRILNQIIDRVSQKQ
jgi:hypothetical protein